LTLHDVQPGSFEIGCFRISSEFICHPGPTLGYRIAENGSSMAYMPDHEPALCSDHPGDEPDWTSGFALADGVDTLIHDAQYSAEEYPEHVGWGHSSLDQTIGFAAAAGVRRLVTFHHDPAHDDQALDHLVEEAYAHCDPPCYIVPGTEGFSIEV
jgi:phosphoribosyl 1,2-cyclic phosphodiesterase